MVLYGAVRLLYDCCTAAGTCARTSFNVCAAVPLHIDATVQGWAFLIVYLFVGTTSCLLISASTDELAGG